MILILTIFQLILIVAVIVYLTTNMIYLVRLNPILMSVANAPKISVCVPARNEERGIKGCLKSLLNQNYSNFEVITVDDHSTDHTGIIFYKSLIKLFAHWGVQIQQYRLPLKQFAS